MTTAENFNKWADAGQAACETMHSGMHVKRRGRPPMVKIDLSAAHERVMTAEQIAHWAYRLELANAMKAGLMDSESRHQEVATQREAIVAAVIAEMRA